MDLQEKAIFTANFSILPDIISRIFVSPWSALALGLIGVILRLINLTTGGLWLDEIWSMQTSASENTVASIIAACKADTHPPLFDLLLHGWLTLFGDSDLSGRSFGLFWGVVGLAATWLYAFWISGARNLAFVALAVLAFNYFHIYYSNEVRFYGFLYVLSLVASAHLYFFLKTSGTKHLVVFTLVAALGLYTHYYMVFFLAAAGVSILLLLVTRNISFRIFWLMVASGVVVLLLFSPWIPVMLHGSESDSWMLLPNWYDFFNYFYLYTGKNPVEFLFLVVFFGLSVRLCRRNPILIILLFGLVFFGFLFPLIVSYIVTPLLHERYTMIYFPVIILLATLGFSDLLQRHRKIAAGVLTGVIISAGINLTFINGYFTEPQKEPWKTISLDIQQQNQTMQTPVYTEMKFWLDYYLEQQYLQPARLRAENISQEYFWVLYTPYDLKQDSIFPEDEFIVEKEINYYKDFRLVLMKK